MDTFEAHCEKAIKENLMEMMKTAMLNFSKAVAEKNGLELDEVLAIWNDANDEMFHIVKAPTKAKAKTKSKAKSKSKAKAKDEDDDTPICEAIVKKTNLPCTFKVSDQSSSGKFCGRHLKQEKEGDEDDVKEKKKSKAKAKPKAKSKAKAKATKKKDEEDENEENDEDEQEEEENKNVVKLMIKKDSFGRYMDLSTSFVFNTKKEVIGKGLPDGSMTKLSDEDLKLCKANKFIVKEEEVKEEKKETKKDEKKVEKKEEKKAEKKEVKKEEVEEEEEDE